MDEIQLAAVYLLAGIVIGMSILTFCWWREKPAEPAAKLEISADTSRLRNALDSCLENICGAIGHDWPHRNGAFEISETRLLYCRRCGVEVLGRTVADLRPPTAEESMDDYFDHVTPEHCECELDFIEEEIATNQCFLCGGKVDG